MIWFNIFFKNTNTNIFGLTKKGKYEYTYIWFNQMGKYQQKYIWVDKK